jgi:BirA family biotin operon repressor/biotin-[acetyl-CoA-carboxylase] ligase
MKAAKAGAKEGLVITANHQTGGRGRFERQWVAPPDKTLSMSVLLRPARPLERWGWLPLMAGVAVADGIRSSAVVRTELKWPNDVQVAGKKISGILLEVGQDAPPAESKFAVIGIGINTGLQADELPTENATSILLEGGRVERRHLMTAVLESLESWYRRWTGGEDLSEPYLQRCATIGKQVRVIVSENEVYEGRAEGIDGEGGLLVRVGDQLRAFAAADVLHLR